MARSGPLPSLDEYVVARGPELLRTAWLLTGDSVRADEAVEEALAAVWPRAGRAPRWGEGSLDAAVRRSMVRGYVRRGPRGAARTEPDERPTVERLAPGTEQDEVARLRRDVLDGLGGLSRLQRAIVVLHCDEGLDDAQVAEVLGRGSGTVRTERARALGALSHLPALEGRRDGADDDDDVAERLGAAFEQIAPESRGAGALPAGSLAAEDLVAGAGRYAARARRRRTAVWAGGAAAVIALGSVVAMTVQRDDAARRAQTPPALSCARLPTDRATPQPGGPALSTRARAALICADRSDRSIWPGSLPPDEPVTDPRGLDFLVLAPPVDKDAHCPRLPVGPAFTITVQGKNGQSATYDNVDLACNGWPTLDRYFIALGEQQAVEAFDPRIDPFPPCPSILGQGLHPRHAGPPGIPKGTVFRAGTACLHLSPDPTSVPVYQRPKRAVLGDSELAALTGEAATHGSGPAVVSCDDSVPAGAVVVVRAVTSEGNLVELTGSRACGLELLVNWSPGDYWTVTRATADAVAADFGGFPR